MNTYAMKSVTNYVCQCILLLSKKYFRKIPNMRGLKHVRQSHVHLQV